MKKIIITLTLFICMNSYSQQDSKSNYWQQHVDYTMDIDVDVTNFQYKGTQQLVYTNNSPDKLTRVFYHLYFNAFQPNSQMDVRSRNIQDPDRRVTDRISKLKPEEIGFIKVNSLTQDGKNVTFQVVGTILEVTLDKPINPGESSTLKMIYNAQVPKQIRRTGQNNKEGVALSMAQWYPKMAEYDFEGWHTPPYIAREFHGVWGDFDVTIHIDKNYTIGGTGYLQNPQEIGHGYEDKSKKLKKSKGEKLSWHFKAPNVHDFMWAADPDYNHDILKTANGIDLHFFYKKNLDEKYLKNWKDLQPKTAQLMSFFSKNVGQYPYKQYSVIQGGDGGMEYAMSTLITGKRSFNSLFGVTSHEMAHTWFQFLLASNESKHPWMDEGFTSYISNIASNKILDKQLENPHLGSYNRYFKMISYRKEESLATHADRYHLNSSYSTASYSMGSMFLSQLEYIIGKENVEKGLKKYFNDFSFKHPTPNDIKRSMEKVSGIHLDWYLNEWTQTTHTIDYSVRGFGNKKIILQRHGKMPMPIDVRVTYKDGSSEDFNIPLQMMRGNKPTSATILKDWSWTHPVYKFDVTKEVSSVEIDPSKLMADIYPADNKRN